MLKNGVSHAPLFFHDGGIQDFFTKLQTFVTIKKYVACCYFVFQDNETSSSCFFNNTKFYFFIFKL